MLAPAVFVDATSTLLTSRRSHTLTPGLECCTREMYAKTSTLLVDVVVKLTVMAVGRLAHDVADADPPSVEASACM